MQKYIGQIVTKVPKGQEDNFIPVPPKELAKVKKMTLNERLNWLKKHEKAIKKASKKKAN